MKKLPNFAFALLLASIVACGGSGTDSPPEPPANQAPSSVAGADFSQVESTQVSLDGTGSSDSDGSIASYTWSQTGGTPTVTLNNSSSATATFTAPEVSADTPLTFDLTVVDNDGASSSDTLVVTITNDQPPIAQAPTDFEAVESSEVILDGSSSTDDVAITSYLWSQTSGPSVTLSNETTATTSFLAPEITNGQSIDLSFELMVEDVNGENSTDSVNVTIIDTPADVTLSGKLTYDHVQHVLQGSLRNSLDYNNIIQSNIRGATVELLSSDGLTIIDTTTSDENGDYSFSVAVNSSHRVRVKAELKQTGSLPSWDFTVVDNTQVDSTGIKPIYAMESSAQAIGTSSTTLNINAPSGWTGSGYGETRVAASFAILDSVYEAKEKILSVDATVAMPALMLNWSINNVAVSGDTSTGQISTSHFNGSEIFILGDEDSDTDEYDGHVIVHEWGHYFEGRMSRSDSIGGSHSSSDRLDLRVAMGEGFGNALSGIVTDDPVYRDSFGSGQSQGFDIDVESDPLLNPGWFSERSVYLMIYDFYDSNSDSNDSLSLGFAPIYEVLIGGEKDTPAFTSIFSFANQLKLANQSNAATIDTMLASQSIIVNDDFGTDESNNGGDARNLPVYQALAIGGSVEVCSYGTNGQYNKLGNRKYLTMDIASTGSHTITAIGQTSGDDPDFVVYQQGSQVFRSEANGNESSTQNINAGQYVLDVYEFSNIQGTVRDTCIDLTLTAN